MAKPLVSDDLWAAIEPLLPPAPARDFGGRPRVPDRAALTGILFVLRSGIPWAMLPPEMGCGSGSTCWRRLRDWQAAGVWLALHHHLLARLQLAERIDWSRVCVDSSSAWTRRVRGLVECVDSSSVPAPEGALARGRTRRTAANRARSAICW